jgi:hypothetical protein
MSFFTWCITHGYKPGMQIDRIDSTKDYEPSNCRFVTIQQNSSRATSKHKVPIPIP